MGDEYNYSPPATNRRLTNADARRIRIRPLETGPLSAVLSVEMVFRMPSAAAPERQTGLSGEVDVNVSLDLRVRDGSPVIDASRA